MKLLSKSLKLPAALLITLTIAVNAFALNEYSELTSPVKLILTGAILPLVIIVVLFYHYQCLKCESCIKKTSKVISLFYVLALSTSSLSILIFTLGSSNAFNEFKDIAVIASMVLHALLVPLGVYVAIKTILELTPRNNQQAQPRGNNDHIKHKKTNNEQVYGRAGYA